MSSRPSFGIRNWLRVAVALIPLIFIEGYWATYSACVIHGTSMDSIWPPIHITFTLGVIAGLCVPIHRSLIRNSRWAQVGAAGLLLAVLVGLLGAITSVWPDHPFGDQFVTGGATILTIVLFVPYRHLIRCTRPFDTREMLALYVLLTTSTLVQGFGAAHFMIPFVIGPHYFATPANHWDTQIFPLLSKWLFISDDAAAKDFYVGHHSVVPWGLWASPLLLWTVYVALVSWVMLGLNGMVRRLWIDNERLTFPQVYLPLEMTRQEEGPILNRFFRSRLMWAGFLVAAALETVAGVHQYFPSAPSFQFRHINLMQSITATPWNSVGGLDASIYPCIIGLTYLLTAEVSWSVWFFYLVRKFLPVMGAQFGWQDTLTQDGTAFPYADHQATGAFFAVGLLAIWSVRKLYRTAKKQHGRFPIAPREIAAMAGGILLLLFWTRLLGISMIVSFGFLVTFFIGCLAYTRVRAETGLGGLTGPMPPQDAFVEVFGSRALNAQDLVALGSMRWGSWDLRFLPSEMPAQLESYKIADSAGIPERALFWAITLAVPFALIVACATELPVIYHYGALQMDYLRYTQIPRDSMTLAARFISNPKGPDQTGLSAGTFGFLFTFLLAFFRARVFSFPFHPLGYAIGFSRRTIEWMWFSIFVGWAAKGLTLRAGGLNAYRIMLPFFLGLLLGDFTMGGFFGLLGCIFPETAGWSVYP